NIVERIGWILSFLVFKAGSILISKVPKFFEICIYKPFILNQIQNLIVPNVASLSVIFNH
ncbi:hypothetical protein, partial [Streptococcus sobrinus]|uniref:hypothetical protein n=1 Tax=Streptococcus sobrinus TaxID=1310 RepID=UPI000515A401